MLENTTNLTNVTILVDVLKSHIDAALLGILIVVTILLFYFGSKIDRGYKHMERIQQEYAKFLKPNAVKLEFDKNKLKYSLQDDLDWSSFFAEVKRQRKYRVHKVPDLYEKAEKTCDKYNESDNSVIIKITSSVTKISGESGFAAWDGNGNKPIVDYIIPEQTVLVIAEIIKRKLKGWDVGDFLIENDCGRFSLYHKRKMAYLLATSDSEEKLKILEKSILSLASDNEIIAIVEELNGIKQDVKEALDAYNEVIAEVIRELRMYPSYRGFLK